MRSILGRVRAGLRSASTSLLQTVVVPSATRFCWIPSGFPVGTPWTRSACMTCWRAARRGWHNALPKLPHGTATHTTPPCCTTANCRTAAHCRTAGQPQTACTRTLPDSRTLLRALPHPATCTATPSRAHCRTLPHSRTLVPHCGTLPHCRTAAHCRVHYHTLLRTPRTLHVLKCCTPYTAHRTQLHNAIIMN